MNVKKVLFVTENYLDGGLETQINTIYSNCGDKIKMYIAVANYNNKWCFKDDELFLNFNFKNNSTVEEFLDDVDHLVDIIKKNNIDCVHVHPFYSLFPAVIAAQITETPVYYTYHGFYSFTFPYNFYTQVMFQYIVKQSLTKLFFVYKNIAEEYKTKLFLTDSVYMPNPIDLKLFKKVKFVQNNEWVYITRISPDKMDTTYKLLNSLDNLNVKKLHIYGDGSSMNELKNFLKNNNLTKKVILHGYCDNISSEIDNKYNGIFANGRSAEEAVAMQIPVCIVGYNKITDLITIENINEYMNNNFAPIFQKCGNTNEISKKICDIDLEKNVSDVYKIFKSEYNVNTYINNYYKEICNNPNNYKKDLLDFYNDLIKIENTKQPFFESEEVYTLFLKNIKDNQIDIDLNTNICLESKYNTLIYKLNCQINDTNLLINNLQNEIELIKSKKVDIGILGIIKNTINHLRKK